MKKLFMAIGVLSLTVFAMTAPALAQTPDGVTPANEGVCDLVKGGTPGLYGLCVAFCEAQDHAMLSRSISEAELEELRNSLPSGRILANYNKKKQDGDPDIPCIKVEEPCPCWDSAQFDQATLAGYPFLGCQNLNAPELNGSVIQFDNRVSPRTFSSVLARTTGSNGTDPICVLRVFDETAGFNVSQRTSLSSDQFRACDAQIRQRATELSLLCSDYP